MRAGCADERIAQLEKENRELQKRCDAQSAVIQKIKDELELRLEWVADLLEKL